MIEHINHIKNKVKTHTIRPFNVSELNVTQDLGGNDRISVKDRFNISYGNTSKLLNAIGIKENLKRKSFKDPQTRWNSLRGALSDCNPDQESQLAAIVNSNNETINIISTGNRDERELDFDDRIDSVVNTVEETPNQSLHGINFTTEGRVNIQTRDQLNEVDCGSNDIWQSGINVDLGYNKQEFNSFYLRLVCTNGMTTTEKTARRQVSAGNIDKQLTRFIEQNDFVGMLKQRVDTMKNEYASVYEATRIADLLTKEQREQHTPWYEELQDTYERAGRPLHSMSAKQMKLAFTDQNLYDVFNTGTYLATHKSEELGENTSMSLNHACADIFKYGPNLKLRTINPYAHKTAIPA